MSSKDYDIYVFKNNDINDNSILIEFKKKSILINPSPESITRYPTAKIIKNSYKTTNTKIYISNKENKKYVFIVYMGILNSPKTLKTFININVNNIDIPQIACELNPDIIIDIDGNVESI